MSNATHRSVPALIGGKGGHLSINIDLPVPSPRYIDELIRSNCFVDLLQTGWYPDAKELTESCAAFRASNKLGLDWASPNVCVICVGDGRYPRTAGMFAYRTQWTSVAVDPQALHEGSVPGVRRCYSLKAKIGQVPRPWDIAGNRVFNDYVFACVHSHAPTDELMRAIDNAPGNVHVISNRCCVDDTLDKEPDHEYLDWGILSPERRVRIWRDYRRLQEAE